MPSSDQPEPAQANVNPTENAQPPVTPQRPLYCHSLAQLPNYPHYGYHQYGASPLSWASPSPAPKRPEAITPIRQKPPSAKGFGAGSGQAIILPIHQQKLEDILNFIESQRWTVADFLHHWSDNAYDSDKDLTRTHKHAASLSAFLGGRCRYKAAKVVLDWIRNRMGLPKRGTPEREYMFSTDHSYTSEGTLTTINHHCNQERRRAPYLHIKPAGKGCGGLRYHSSQ
ncbi:hypothetical protein VKT23_009210 [Stygiomarasmius scandens]|uniref:Uncharacterized protein n=1 Tax=Marasmiellus scandens TaxID=2682957 RepID=A0ABR1JFK4_9AGAR